MTDFQAPSYSEAVVETTSKEIADSATSVRWVSIAARYGLVGPLAALGVYLVGLVLDFERMIRAVYLNGDAVFTLVLAEDLNSLASAGEVNMGNNRYYSTLWFLMATKHLSNHRALWQFSPYLTLILTVGLMAWGCLRCLGRWAAVLTCTLGLGLSHWALRTALVPGYRITTWFAGACLLALLLWFSSAEQPRWPSVCLAAAFSALVAGLTLGSDSLFIASGLGPFLLASLGLGLIRPDDKARRLMILAAGVTGAAVAVGWASDAWMRSLGFSARWPAEGFRFASGQEVWDNAALFLQSVLALGNGSFFSVPFGIASMATLAAAVVILLALLIPFLVLRELAANSGEQKRCACLWTLFWTITVFGVSAVMILSNVPVGGGLGVLRYLIPVYFGLVALVPVWAISSGSRRILLSGAATVIILLAWHSQKVFYLDLQQPLARHHEEIAAYLSDNGLVRGYSAYSNAHALTWNTGMKVRVHPVRECRLPESSLYCPYELASRRAWYQPKAGRSFVLIEKDAPIGLSPSPPAEFGKPVKVHRIGPFTIYAYDYDVASKFLALRVPELDPKVVVVMPAHNAGRTLQMTYEAVPAETVSEVILVDDKSTDDTLKIAQMLPMARVIWHPHNVGYGGNQKTCYLEALQRGADVVVMLHPDGQYEPSLIPDLIRPILEGKADLVLGSRLAVPGMARAGGMPLYKFFANKVLTSIENLVLGTRLSEMHTGYRAYSRRLLLTVPFLRNSSDFSFDSEMLMQAVHFGFKIAEVPARSRYFDDASSVGFKDGVVYGIKTLGAAGRFILNKWKLLPSRKFQP